VKSYAFFEALSSGIKYKGNQKLEAFIKIIPSLSGYPSLGCSPALPGSV
jgi:hypothetical protein